MKTRHLEKLKKYVLKNDLSKLKHLKRKHHLDLSTALFKDSNTLLHVAYEYGHTEIARYLQKHGCSLLQQNLDGDLPLHKACIFFIKHYSKSVYDSVIVPMTTAYPELLSQKNKVGVTPRELLQQAWLNKKQQGSPVLIDSDSDADSVEIVEEENLRPNRSTSHSKSVGYLQRSIEQGDLRAVKRLQTDSSITVEMVVFADGNTPLHTAAEWGQAAVLRYLLHVGCDPLLVNSHGDLPLHKACSFAKETDIPYVYHDLVEPLVTAALDSVDVENNRGQKCRQTVSFLKARAKEDCIREDSVSDCDGNDDDSGFCRRLFEEMMSEYGEISGQYEQDFADYQNSNEDTGAWMDRLTRERKRKHQGSFSTGASGSKKKSKTPEQKDKGSSAGTKQGKISDEQKAEFNRKLKAQYKEEETRHLKKSQLEKRLQYELRCDSVFKKKQGGSVTNSLGYKDIPWPHGPGKGVGDVVDFLFGNMDRQTGEYARYVKVQQVRWHPDRFLQKCGDRLKVGEKEEVMRRVNEISQVLNSVNKGD